MKEVMMHLTEEELEGLQLYVKDYGFVDVEDAIKNCIYYTIGEEYIEL